MAGGKRGRDGGKERRGRGETVMKMEIKKAGRSERRGKEGRKERRKNRRERRRKVRRKSRRKRG